MKCVGLLLLLLFNLDIFCYGYNSNRIHKGQDAPLDKYHNVLRLHGIIVYPMENNGTKLGYTKSLPVGTCTASIISSRHILTAGHCVTFSRYAPNVTEYEAIVLDFHPVKIPWSEFEARQEAPKMPAKDVGFATQYHIHKDWAWQPNIGDVAIIEFPVGAKLGEPVLLAKNYQEGPNDIGLNVGFGDTSPDPTTSVSPKTLQQITLPILSGKNSPFDASVPVIAAGNATHRPSHGDSGGPLFFNAPDGKQYQIGVAHDLAFKNGTSEQHYPDLSVFMRVSTFCPWIEEKTNGEAKCVEIGTASRNDSTLSTTAAPPSGALSKNIISVILLAIVFAFVF